MGNIVNPITGEVQSIPFRCPYDKIEKIKEDCSNPFQKRFKELPPYAVDLETGKIINKLSVPVLVPDEDFNIDEYIQSFKDDCDIYAILEKFALTGCTDTSLINRGVMSFGDISELPDNFNDMNEYFDKATKNLKKFSDDIAKQVLDDSVSIDVIQKGLNDKVAAAEKEAAAKKVEVK